jgi:hypothetical protein
MFTECFFKALCKLLSTFHDLPCSIRAFPSIGHRNSSKPGHVLTPDQSWSVIFLFCPVKHTVKYNYQMSAKNHLQNYYLTNMVVEYALTSVTHGKLLTGCITPLIECYWDLIKIVELHVSGILKHRVLFNVACSDLHCVLEIVIFYP